MMSSLKVASINHPSAGGGGLSISPAGNVSGAGLDLIVSQSFSAVSAMSIDGCFTSDYDNYRVVVDGLASASGYMQIRFRASGADNSASTYASTAVLQRMVGAGGLVGNVGGYTSSGLVGYFGVLSGQASIDVTSPALSKVTKYAGSGSGLVSASEGYGGSTVGVFNNTTAFDGFTIYPASGTITGTLRVYGYRN